MKLWNLFLYASFFLVSTSPLGFLVTHTIREEKKSNFNSTPYVRVFFSLLSAPLLRLKMQRMRITLSALVHFTAITTFSFLVNFFSTIRCDFVSIYAHTRVFFHFTFLEGFYRTKNFFFCVR